jgi:hypothetical protein
MSRIRRAVKTILLGIAILVATLIVMFFLEPGIPR